MINSKVDDKNISLSKNLSWLRQELDVYCLIAINADNINKKGIGKSFWGFLQKSCIDLIALSICKIFECEKQNKKGKVNYELSSIDGVLRYLVNEKPSALDSSRVCSFIRKYDCSPNEDKLLSGLSSTFTSFKEEYHNELEMFKTIRDKRIAHSEFGFNPNDLPSYDVMERLFNFGSEFYMLVSSAFVSTASVSVVPCDLNSDRKVKIGLKRILHKLGLTDIKTEME